MSITKQEQFEKLLNSSKNILIVLPENPTGDEIGSAFGLSFILEKVNLNTTIAFSDPNHCLDLYSFLPTPKNIIHSLSGSRDFIITFKTNHNKITNVESKEIDNKLEIRVTPEKGIIDSRDFSFGLAEFPYDLMITLGLSNKENSGSIYKDMPDIFFDTPIVNIDNDASNENIGQLNIVKLTSSSISEVVLSLFEEEFDNILDYNIAQCFLTGITIATNSFRSKMTTPKALSYAGNMIDAGADQQKIVTNLYKTQTIGFIKLWGYAFKNLQKSPDGSIITTTISKINFKKTNTGVQYLSNLMEKIKQNHFSGKIFVIIYESENRIKALIDSSETRVLAKELITSDSDVNYITLDVDTVELGREKILEKLSK